MYHYYFKNLTVKNFQLDRKEFGRLNATGTVPKEDFQDYYKGILLEDEDEEWYDCSLDYAAMRIIKILRALQKNEIFKYDSSLQEGKICNINRKFR